MLLYHYIIISVYCYIVIIAPRLPQCHPSLPVLATSGIEDVVRLWGPADAAPSGQQAEELREQLAGVVARNQERMREGPSLLRWGRGQGRDGQCRTRGWGACSVGPGGSVVVGRQSVLRRGQVRAVAGGLAFGVARVGLPG